MIQFEHISKYYKHKKKSVHDINLSIKRGEFVTLIGHSGSGKTTLLKLLVTEEKPSSGKIYFDDINIHNLRSRDIPRYRQRIGVIFQDYKLLKDKTVYENVAFAMEMIGKSDREIRSDVPHALELVGLQDKMFHFPGELSGGEQQRLAIARAIINQPELLIADEPTDSLDEENVAVIINILKKINELGTTVILSTHNPQIIKTMRERVIHLEKGHVISDTQEK